ncbi:MAG: TraB/GumN family protein [Saprospiraceae bacterium]|nr:TraB/GumN family protein [Saprospiraceae bacterium]
MSKQSLLWQITPKKGGSPSYLFGTMHVRDLRAFEWLELAKDHLQQCKLFATEFDFLESDPAALAAALTLPEGLDLHQLLRPSAWKNLDRIAKKKLNSSAEVFRKEHPMSVSSTLSMMHLLAETPYSLDETLWHFARSLPIPTTGVESFSEQIETIHRIPLETHVKGLTWLLKNEARHKRRMQKMLRWYSSGDLKSLYQSAKKDAKGMREVLLYRRNKIMAERFVELASSTSLFCAVGAGHLAGGKGMLRLIKKAGFKITPIIYGTA